MTEAEDSSPRPGHVHLGLLSSVYTTPGTPPRVHRPSASPRPYTVRTYTVSAAMSPPAMRGGPGTGPTRPVYDWPRLFYETRLDSSLDSSRLPSRVLTKGNPLVS